MRRIRIVLAALALALALAAPAVVVTVAATPEPAAAHQYDTLSYWYCSKHRSGPDMTVIHSRPWALEPGVIIYYCGQRFFDQDFQFFVRVAPPGSNNSTLASGYQKCDHSPGGYVNCELEHDW
jgi:hypothetical protein